MGDYNEEKWLQTGIDNDFVFYYVMNDNPDICLELLQMIFPELGIKSVKIQETQKTYEESPTVHGVRLDVYTEDSDDRAYDIEMQAMNRGNIRKRSRYNQSIMDRRQLRKTADYDSLKDSFVVFICNFDLFGQNRCVYVFENTCQDDYNIKLEDGMKKVFINAKGSVGEISDKLRCFLKMVAEHEATDEFTRKIQKTIDYLHRDDEAREKYMTFEMKIIEERRIAKEEGRAEGLEKGLEKGRAEGLETGKLLTTIDLVKKGYITTEIGAKESGMTVEEFEKKLYEK